MAPIITQLQDYQGEIDINVTLQAIEKTLALCKTVRKNPPKRLIIYRNECSDGWLSFILSYEVPMIKKVLAKTGCKDTKLTVIVASRLQSVRFFRDKVCIIHCRPISLLLSHRPCLDQPDG